MLIDRELDRERLISRVGALTGASREEIERAVEATLEALAEWGLSPDYEPADFYHAVSAHEGAGLGVAMEHVGAVSLTVSELVAEEDREHLPRHLPEELERLVRPAAPDDDGGDSIA